MPQIVENVTFCDHCRNSVPPEDFIPIRRYRYLCRMCYRRSYDTCSVCERVYARSSMLLDAGVFTCSYCRSGPACNTCGISVHSREQERCDRCNRENFRDCRNCRQVFLFQSPWNRPYRYLEHYDESLCDSCQMHPELRNNKKPRLTFPSIPEEKQYITNKFFGLEIELTLRDLDCGGSAISAQFPSWGWCCDHSIHGGRGYNNGREFLSPILYGDAGILEARQFVKLLRSLNNFKPNKSCGLHVHVNATDLSWEQVRNVAACWARIEPFLHLCVPKSRVKNNNCRPVDYTVEQLVECQNEFDFASITYGFPIKNDCSLKYEKRSKYNESRYYGLNLHSYFYQGTLEFRLHSSTMNSEKLERWIEVCTRIVEFGVQKVYWTEEEIMNLFRVSTQSYLEMRKDTFYPPEGLVYQGSDDEDEDDLPF